MIKAIIIDDEENSRVLLKNMIQRFCHNIEVIGLFGNIKDAYNAISITTPDVIFLDIVMNGETGFDLVDKISSKNIDIIFITAYESYALKAIKFSALDYILKPITPEDLQTAVSKLTEKKDTTNNSAQQKVWNLIQMAKSPDIANHRIALSYEGGISFIPIPDILRCEGSGAYTTFHIKSHQKIMVSKNLGEFEDLLNGYNFFRIHNSFIVNLNEIKNYIRGNGGYIVMSDNETVDVSKNKKAQFLEKMGIK